MKPCPFCGEHPNIDEYTTVGGHVELVRVVCSHAAHTAEVIGSPEFASKAWNTRAERTCYAKPHYSTRSDTCGTVIGFDCSECAYALTQDPDRPILWRYCPNCGAKVVDE